MQYSISAFFLKEVSDMDVYEKLEELQEKALHDDTIRKTLLKTREEKEPILARDRGSFMNDSDIKE